MIVEWIDKSPANLHTFGAGMRGFAISKFLPFSVQNQKKHQIVKNLTSL
jgi:hypothetical protein